MIVYPGLLIALLFTSVVAVAQTPGDIEPASNQPDREQIVVSGNRVKTAEDVRALRRFAEQVLEPAKTDQLARWNARVCPKITGVRDAEARFIRERITSLASDVGLRVADGECNTTMLIAFSLGAGELAISLTDRKRVLLRQDGYVKWQQFRETHRPVRWLTVTDFCSEGCALPNSRLSHSSQANFQILVVIVDHEQIGDFQIGELADYLAMVSLAAPDMDGPWPKSSILAMFDTKRDESARFGLTDYDLALLRGLYASRGNATGREQVSRIVAEMTADIDPATDPRGD